MEHKPIIYSVSNLKIEDDGDGNLTRKDALTYGKVAIRPGNDQVDITNRCGESIIVDASAIECLAIALKDALKLIRLTNRKV